MNEISWKKKYSKDWYMNEMVKVFNKHEILNDILRDNIDNVNIMGGAWYVHGLCHTYPFRWLYGLGESSHTKDCKLYGIGKQKTKLWQYRRKFDEAKEELKGIKEFLTEKGIKF